MILGLVACMEGEYREEGYREVACTEEELMTQEHMGEECKGEGCKAAACKVEECKSTRWCCSPRVEEVEADTGRRVVVCNHNHSQLGRCTQSTFQRPTWSYSRSRWCKKPKLGIQVCNGRNQPKPAPPTPAAASRRRPKPGYETKTRA